MDRGALALLCALASSTTGCLATSGEQSGVPDRVRLSAQGRSGIAAVDDDTTDGAEGPSVALGFQGAAGYRLLPHTVLGVGLDITVSEHDSAGERNSVSYWSYGLAFHGRFEVDRIAAGAWGGWYTGSRALSSTGFSNPSVGLSGPALGAFAAWRFLPEGAPAIEIGPYLTYGRFEIGDDRSEDDGAPIHAIGVGLSIAAVFGDG